MSYDLYSELRKRNAVIQALNSRQQTKKKKRKANWFEKTADTFGDLNGQVISGFVKGLEGIYDAGASIVGAVGGIFSDNFQDSVKDHVAYDFTGKKVTSYLNDWFNDSYLNDMGKTGDIIQDVTSGVGQMLPAVLVTIATGGAGAGAFVTPGMATMGASAMGNATESAFKDGAGYGEGLAYGVAGGATEMVTEKLGGKLFGNTAIDDALGLKPATKTLFKGAKTRAGKVVQEAISESAEEAVAELFNPLTKTIYKGTDAFKDYADKEYWKGVGESALIGAGTSFAFGQTVGRINRNTNNANESLQELKTLEIREENLHANGKLFEGGYQQKIDNLRNKLRTELSESVQKMDEQTRTKYIKKYNLANILNSDGSLKVDMANSAQDIKTTLEGAKNGLASQSNKEAYSPKFFGNENNLLIQPTNKELTQSNIDAKLRINKLNKGYNRVGFAFVDDGAIKKLTGQDARAIEYKGVIYIEHGADVESSQKVLATHELNHTLEGTKQKANFDNFIIKSLMENEVLATRFGSFSEKFTETLNRYKKVFVEKYGDISKATGEDLQQIKAEMTQETINEVVSQYVSEKLFTDEATIDRLASTDESIFKKIYNWIKTKVERFKIKSAEDRQVYDFLHKAESLYKKALENSRGGTNYTSYSIDKKDKTEYNISKQEYAILSSEVMRKNALQGNKNVQKINSAYTSNYYYVFDTKGYNDFKVLAQLSIEGNEHLINLYETLLEDKNGRNNYDAKEIRTIISDIKNEQGFYDSSRIDVAERQSDSRDGEIHREQFESNRGRNSTESSRDRQGNVKYSFASNRSKVVKYLSYDRVGNENVRYIKSELSKLFEDVEDGIANSVAIGKENNVYIVDAGKEAGEISFGIRKKYTFSSSELQAEYIRRRNNESISKGYISDGLSSKFRDRYDSDWRGDRRQEFREELSTDKGKSEDNQARVLGNNANRRGRLKYSFASNRSKVVKYLSYAKVGNKNVSYIRRELTKLYSNHDDCVADGVAIEKGNTIYVVDSGKDDGDLRFGVRRAITISDENLRKERMVKINDRAIQDGFISEQLLGEIRSSSDSNSRGSIRQELQKELSVNSRESEDNQERISRQNADRRRIKFSIESLSNGNQYVKADRAVIQGTNVETWKVQVKEYLENVVRQGKDIKIKTVEGDILTISKTTVGKSTYKDNKLGDKFYKVKLNAEVHIDELAQTSKIQKQERTPDINNKHQKYGFADDGWTYRDAYFLDGDGEYYKITISVGHNGEVATIYNVGTIKKSQLPKDIKYPILSSMTPATNSSYDKSIPQNNTPVNNNYDNFEKNDTDNKKFKYSLTKQNFKSTNWGDGYSIDNLDVNEYNLIRLKNDTRIREFDRLLDKIESLVKNDGTQTELNQINSRLYNNLAQQEGGAYIKLIDINTAFDDTVDAYIDNNNINIRQVYIKNLGYNGVYVKPNSKTNFESVVYDINVKKVNLLDYSPDRAKARLDKAIKLFGETKDPKKAGWLLTDGRFVDYNRDSNAILGEGEGDIDYQTHNEIEQVYEDKSNTDAIDAFMAEGNIRLMPEAGGIEVRNRPNFEQQLQLIKYIDSIIDEKGIYLDLFKPNSTENSLPNHVFYDSTTDAKTIIRDINAFYNTGRVAKTVNGIKFSLSQENSAHSVAKYEEKSYNKNTEYTKYQYERFGWVRANDVLTKNQWNDFNKKFATSKNKSNVFVKTINNELIIPVNNMVGETFGIDNVLVFVKGTFQYPNITKIIKIDLADETSIDYVRRFIYDNEKRANNQTSNALKNIFREELISEMSVRDFPSYQEYKGTKRTEGSGRDGSTNNSNTEQLKQRTRDINSNKFSLTNELNEEQLWAKLTKREQYLLYNSIDEIHHQGFYEYQLDNGDYLIDIDNKIVITDGDFDRPSIEGIIEFNKHSNKISEARDNFYEKITNRRPIWESIAFINTMHQEEVAIFYGNENSKYDSGIREQGRDNYQDREDNTDRERTRVFEDVKYSLTEFTEQHLWAKLTKREQYLLYNSIDEIHHQGFYEYQLDNGDYLIDIDNKIVITDGDFDRPSIEGIVELTSFDNNNITKARDYFYEINSTAIRESIRLVNNLCEEEVAIFYRRKNSRYDSGIREQGRDNYQDREDNTDRERTRISREVKHTLKIEDKQEYAKLSSALAKKNGNSPKATEYVYTDKYFYIVKNNRLGNFEPILQIDIEVNRNLINVLTKELENGSYRKAKTIDEWIGFVQSGTRGNNWNNDYSSEARTNRQTDEFYDEESRSNSRNDSSKSGRDFKRKIISYHFNEDGSQEITYKDVKYSLKRGGYFPEINISTENVANELGIKDINNITEVIKKVSSKLEDTFLTTNNQQKYIKNIDTGIELTITKAGIKETFGNKRYYHEYSVEQKLGKLASMKHLAKLIKYGEVRAESAKNYHNPNSTTTFTYLYAPITIDNIDYDVSIDLKQTQSGNRFYIHGLQMKKKSDIHAYRQSKSSILGAQRQTSNNNSISQINTAVNNKKEVEYSAYPDRESNERRYYNSDGSTSYDNSISQQDTAVNNYYAKSEENITKNNKIKFALNENSSQVVDSYSESQYNKFGWVRANDILNEGQFKDFNSKFAKTIIGEVFNKTKNGELMIAVSDIYSKDMRGIQNAIVYVKGTIDSPKITSVVKIDLYNETDLDDKRRIIYESERRGIQQKTGGIFRRYDSFNFEYSLYSEQRTISSSIGNNSNDRFRRRSGEETKRIKSIHFNEDGSQEIIYDSVEQSNNKIKYSLSKGQVAKDRANNSKMKVYSKIEAEKLINEIVAERDVEITDKKVRATIKSLYEEGLNVFPRSIGKTIIHDSESIELTKRQHTKFTQIYSQANYKISSLVNGKSFEDMPSVVKAKSIKCIYDYYYEEALKDLLGIDSDEKKYLFARAIDITKLAMIVSQVSQIEADLDKNGKTISGSKKAKITSHVNSMNLTATQKYMLMGYFGYKNTKGERQVKLYIQSLKLTKTEKETLFKLCGYDNI